MQAAHDQDVLHRDLKPGNILVGPGDHVFVTDFGLAAPLDQPGASLTADGLAIGTPAYMSPEQAAGQRQLDKSSDVYSLGAVLYTVLAGSPPHRGDSAMTTMIDVINKPVADPVSLNPDADRVLSRIALKCLHKDPRKRYANGQSPG